MVFFASMPGKLADLFIQKIPSNSELYLVEVIRLAVQLKAAVISKTQAILPLRGKVLTLSVPD